MRSVKKLKAIRGIHVLLAAWDEPRGGKAAYRQMDRALLFLQRIHESVITVSADGTQDPMEIARRTAAFLRLPPQIVTPLLAHTLMANIRMRDHPDLEIGT